MASASSTSAKHLFSDSKRRLADRVAINVNNATSVTRQILRGGKTKEILMNSCRTFAHQETAMATDLENLRKTELIYQQLGYQYDAIREATDKFHYLDEQVSSMEKYK